MASGYKVFYIFEKHLHKKMDKTLLDYQDAWESLVDKAMADFSSLNRDERVWYTIQSLMDSVDNGGIVSHYYNSGADYNRETIEDLDLLGFTQLSALLKKVNALFPNGQVPADIDDRNDIISNWDISEHEELFDDADKEFYSHEKELEESLLRHIESKLGDL